MSKSTVGFGRVKVNRGVSSVIAVNNIDLLKLGLEEYKIESLSCKEKDVIIDIIQYGKQKRTKTKLEKLSLDVLNIIKEAVKNRLDETYTFIYDDAATQEFCLLLKCTGKKSDLILESLGTYAYYLSNTLEELQLIITTRPKDFKVYNSTTRDNKSIEKQIWFSTKPAKAEVDTVSEPKVAVKERKANTSKEEEPKVKRRGRPKGSKNKPKVEPSKTTLNLKSTNELGIETKVTETVNNIEDVTDNNEPIKRKPGRPKGSKNKPKEIKVEQEQEQNGTKRKPGRPKGSKNKPKEIEIKQEPIKRKPGRPKGSKNKPKEIQVDVEVRPDEIVVKRRPGRPKGSKNKEHKEVVHERTPRRQCIYNMVMELAKEESSNEVINKLAVERDYTIRIEQDKVKSLTEQIEDKPKRKRGRPKGSKNKPKDDAIG